MNMYVCSLAANLPIYLPIYLYRLLVGTASSEIFELDLLPTEPKRSAIVRYGGLLVTGHFKDEVWGLATHSTRREYATVGDDGTLR